MDVLLLVALGLFAIAALSGAAMAVSARRMETEQDRAALRRRLVTIARQRNDYYND